MSLLATLRESRQVNPDMTAPSHQPASLFFLSDRHRAPDWRAALRRGGPNCGLILRDYDAPDRAALAEDMRIACRAEKRFFAIAGDRKLAARMGAAFHCPSYLLRRPLRHGLLGSLGPHDTAAVHNEGELIAAARAGFRRVFIAPIFPTRSHIGQVALGPVRARRLACHARALGLVPLALGGLDAKRLKRLNGAAAVFYGLGAIDAFAAR